MPCSLGTTTQRIHRLCAKSARFTVGFEPSLVRRTQHPWGTIRAGVTYLVRTDEHQIATVIHRVLCCTYLKKTPLHLERWPTQHCTLPSAGEKLDQKTWTFERLAEDTVSPLRAAGRQRPECAGFDVPHTGWMVASGGSKKGGQSTFAFAVLFMAQPEAMLSKGSPAAVCKADPASPRAAKSQ